MEEKKALLVVVIFQSMCQQKRPLCSSKNQQSVDLLSFLLTKGLLLPFVSCFKSTTSLKQHAPILLASGAMCMFLSMCGL